MFEIDPDMMREAFAGPGMDPRQWVSVGTVDPDTDGARSVTFDERLGPLVQVTLQPSGTSVQCRVMGSVAGKGEAEYYPFAAADEVIVALPQGEEASGGVILGRLSNEIDTWPRKVAGQDVTTNTLAFRRMRAPYAVETSAPYLIRSALTGTQFGLDEKGQILMNDGEGSRFFMGPDALSLGTQDGATVLQVLPPKGQVFLQGKGASLTIDQGETKFMSPGTISFSTAGAGATGHAITLEQVISILSNLMLGMGLGGMLAPSIAGAWAAPGAAYGQIGTVLAGALAGAVAPVPFAGGPSGAAAPGGTFLPAYPPLAALAGALAIPPDPLGLMPGVGRAGFML